MNIKALLREVYQQGYNDGFWDMQQSREPDLYEGDPDAAESFMEKVLREGKIGNVPLDGWISVDSEMPPLHKDVLCFLDDEHITVGQYSDAFGWMLDSEDTLEAEVTHWQRIEPPKV